MEEPIRVLHIVGAMYPGGMENFIMNLYENIDREKIQFDMIVHSRKENDYVKQIEAMGGHVYLIPRMVKHPIKNLKAVSKIVKENQYKLVVRHTPNALVTPQLLAAKKAGAVTVCHSHNETDPQKFAHKCGKLLMNKATDKRVACSEKAGIWMYGKKDFEVIHNAIDLKKFQFSNEGRQRIRDEFGLGECRVYGHIANFIESKNHRYLLHIFDEIVKKDPAARLICAGEGDLRPQIEAEIASLGLQDKVILTGIRNDVEDLLSAFDVLIFPSIFEGLPLSLIEAQTSGINCLISDTITPNVIVTEGLVHMESIEKDPSVWANRAMKLGQDMKRICQKDNIAKAGYDILQLAKWYEQFVRECIEE